MSIGAYRGPMYEGPRGSRVQVQITAEIPRDVFPQACYSMRMSDQRKEEMTNAGVKLFPTMNNATDLTINNDDLVFQAREGWEIADILGKTGNADLTKLQEHDTSPFSVFNSLLKPATLQEAHITYKFLGVMRSGPLQIDPQQGSESLLVATAGVVNFFNALDLHIPAFTPMTWAIDDVDYRDAEQDEISQKALHMYTFSKRQRYEAALVKGYFKPAHVATLRESIAVGIIKAIYEPGGVAIVDDQKKYDIARIKQKAISVLDFIDTELKEPPLPYSFMARGAETQHPDFSQFVRDVSVVATQHFTEIVAICMNDVEPNTMGQVLLVPHC